MKVFQLLKQFCYVIALVLVSQSAGWASTKPCTQSVRNLNPSTGLAGILRQHLPAGFYRARLIPEFSVGFSASHEHFLRVEYGDPSFEAAPEFQLSLYASENPLAPWECDVGYKCGFKLLAHSKSDLKFWEAGNALFITKSENMQGRQVVEDTSVVLLDHRIRDRQNTYYYYFEAFDQIRTLFGGFSYGQFKPAKQRKLKASPVSSAFQPNILLVRMKPRNQSLEERVFAVEFERRQ